MKRSANEPIVLSGRVFVSKLLAREMSWAAVPDSLRHGDVKLLAIAKGHGYAGFITAYVWSTADRRWRKLALRAGAAVEAIYQGPVERRTRARAAIEHVRKLGNTSVVWEDRTYKAPKLQQNTSSSGSASVAGQDVRSSTAAAPAMPNSVPGSAPLGKTAEAPAGKPGEQLRLF